MNKVATRCPYCDGRWLYEDCRTQLRKDGEHWRVAWSVTCSEGHAFQVLASWQAHEYFIAIPEKPVRLGDFPIKDPGGACTDCGVEFQPGQAFRVDGPLHIGCVGG